MLGATFFVQFIFGSMVIGVIGVGVVRAYTAMIRASDVVSDIL